MAGWKETISSIGAGTGNILWIIVLTIAIGGLALILLIGGGLFYYFRKRYNLRVEIKLLRSGGKLVSGEWGRGLYDSKKGVVFIKRKKMKAIPIKIFDLRKYLQGEDLLTVIQVGPEDYLPVLNESYQEYIDDKTGEKAALMDIKVDKGEDKAWKTAFASAAKQAYSLKSFFQQFQTPIAIGIVVICVFVGFAIIWSRLGLICG